MAPIRHYYGCRNFARLTVLVALVTTVGSCANQTNEIMRKVEKQSATLAMAVTTTVAPLVEIDPAAPIETSIPTLATSIPTPPGSGATHQVAVEFIDLINLRLQCGRTPAKCPIESITAPNSESRTDLTNLMKFRVENNLATRPNDGAFRIRIENIEILSTETALVHTCSFDSLVLFDLGQSNSARDDIIFDDNKSSIHATWQLAVDDGHWKWLSVQGHGTNYEKDICGFTS